MQQEELLKLQEERTAQQPVRVPAVTTFILASFRAHSRDTDPAMPCPGAEDSEIRASFIGFSGISGHHFQCNVMDRFVLLIPPKKSHSAGNHIKINNAPAVVLFFRLRHLRPEQAR